MTATMTPATAGPDSDPDSSPHSSSDPVFSVYETFTSLQGESTYAGLPCYFIRLAHCNLRCSYCDTAKAWSAASGHAVRLSELVAGARAAGPALCEVTGGEPLCSPHTPRLCAALAAVGLTVLVETNGSLDCAALPPEAIRILDCKTPSSGEDGRMYEPNFRSLRPVDQVKFVVSDRADFDFALDRIRAWDLFAQTPHVLISPVTGRLDLTELAAWVVGSALPLRLNLQLHKIIWGADAEGV